MGRAGNIQHPLDNIQSGINERARRMKFGIGTRPRDVGCSVFPPMSYFDHNATHPLSDVALEAWLRATRDFIGNPSSLHRVGARAEKALDQARERLAGWLGC